MQLNVACVTLKLFNLQFGPRIDANGSNKYALYAADLVAPAWKAAESLFRPTFALSFS